MFVENTLFFTDAESHSFRVHVINPDDYDGLCEYLATQLDGVLLHRVEGIQIAFCDLHPTFKTRVQGEARFELEVIKGLLQNLAVCVPNTFRSSANVYTKTLLQCIATLDAAQRHARLAQPHPN